MGDMRVSERWRRSRRSYPRSRHSWLLLLLLLRWWRWWWRRKHNAITLALPIHRLRARARGESNRSRRGYGYTGSSRRRHRTLSLHRMSSSEHKLLWRSGLLLGWGLLLRRRWRRRDHAPWKSTRAYGRAVWCAPAALLRSAWWRWRWLLRLRLDGFAVCSAGRTRCRWGQRCAEGRHYSLVGTSGGRAGRWSTAIPVVPVPVPVSLFPFPISISIPLALTMTR